MEGDQVSEAQLQLLVDMGVLQHIGAELSAHETIAAEQEAWGSIAQLAAEYETLANQHDVETLLPRLVRARSFGDADDIAAILHYRVARATARPAGSGRTRKASRLIAGLIPEATGTMTPEMRRALTERRELIEARAINLLDMALRDGQPWTTALGPEPKDA